MITEKNVPIFTTSDGTEFNDKIAAEAHESVIDAYDAVDAFIKVECADSKPRHKTTMRNYILSYISWAKMQELQPKEAEAKPTATPAAAAKPATGKGKAKAA